MWSGWLPSRPLQWNDINGRLNLGAAGAAVNGERPIVVNRWPSAGSLGYQAKAEGFAPGGNAATFAERFPRREDRNDREKGSARWGASAKSHLAGTAGRSGFAGGMGGSGGGLGTGGGVAQVPRGNSSAEPKDKKVVSPSKPSSPSRPGPRGGGGTPSPGPASPTTTVGDLATNGPGTGAVDLGSGIGDPGRPIGGSGGSSGLAATPEPASIMLIGTGFLAAAGLVRRRRK